MLARTTIRTASLRPPDRSYSQRTALRSGGERALLGGAPPQVEERRDDAGRAAESLLDRGRLLAGGVTEGPLHRRELVTEGALQRRERVTESATKAVAARLKLGDGDPQSARGSHRVTWSSNSIGEA